MKFLILFLILLPFTAIAGQEVIVDFRYGNQIFGSTLQILEDGSVVHGERKCCPPSVDDVTEQVLADSVLSSLISWVADAESGAVSSEQGRLTADGSPSGTLTVFRDGKEIIVHVIERGIDSRYDRVQINNSSGAQKIEDLVNSYVKTVMYK